MNPEDVLIWSIVHGDKAYRTWKWFNQSLRRAGWKGPVFAQQPSKDLMKITEQWAKPTRNPGKFVSCFQLAFADKYVSFDRPLTIIADVDLLCQRDPIPAFEYMMKSEADVTMGAIKNTKIKAHKPSNHCSALTPQEIKEHGDRQMGTSAFVGIRSRPQSRINLFFEAWRDACSTSPHGDQAAMWAALVRNPEITAEVLPKWIHWVCLRPRWKLEKHGPAPFFDTTFAHFIGAIRKPNSMRWYAKEHLSLDLKMGTSYDEC